MKVVILAGGFGTRLSEETAVKPKPMVEIGGRPILIHIMKLYSYYGCHEFIICSGYKGWVIKEFFSNYYLHMSDLTFDLKDNSVQIHDNYAEPWKVTVVDTGPSTLTGGRVKRVQKYLGNEPFMLTYGDGLADINIRELLAFHRKQGRIATVTAVQPAGRFGSLDIGGNEQVLSFVEKPGGDRAWINGGFFVMQPEIFDFLPGDQCSLEREPLEKLARQGELAAFKHRGFWQPMDTLRDRHLLEELWDCGRAPWKLW